MQGERGLTAWLAGWLAGGRAGGRPGRRVGWVLAGWLGQVRWVLVLVVVLGWSREIGARGTGLRATGLRGVGMRARGRGGRHELA